MNEISKWCIKGFARLDIDHIGDFSHVGSNRGPLEFESAIPINRTDILGLWKGISWDIKFDGDFIGGGKGRVSFGRCCPELCPVSTTALKNHIANFRFAGDEFTEGAFLLLIIKQMDHIVDRAGLNEFTP